MQLADLERILPVRDDIVTRFVVSRHDCELGFGELGEWVEEEAIDSDNCHTDDPGSYEGAYYS